MNTSNKVATVLLGAVLGLASSAAGATVVYHWTPTSSSQTMQTLSGTLEIDNAAWYAGSIDYDFTRSMGDPGDPNSPIIASLLTVSSVPIGSAFDVRIDPRSDGGFATWHMHANLGFDHTSGLLTGNLYVNNSESDYTMSSNDVGSLWAITGFNTDFSLGQCYHTGVCSGATGVWTLDPSTIPVPEPGTLGLTLFGFGLMSVAFGLRRRQAR